MGNMPPRQQDKVDFPDHLIDTAAERALLAAIMADNSVIHRVNGHLAPEHFADPLHGRIFDAMRAMAKDQAKINPVTLLPLFQQDLAFAGWEGMTPQRFLVDIARAVVSTIDAEDYAPAIIEAFTRRQLIVVSRKLADRAINERFQIEGGSFSLTPEQATAKILADGRQELAGLEAVLSGPQAPDRLEDSADAVLQAIEDAMYQKGPPPGVPVGLIDIDDKTGGLFPEELIIVAGRPGMGKTVYALSTAWRAARGAIEPIIFTLEMPKKQLIGRLLAMESGVPTGRQRTGKISPEEFDRLIEAKRRLGQLPIHILDDPRVTTAQIEARARSIIKPGRRYVIIIDYLQLIRSEGVNKNTNRVQELTQITRDLKLIGRILKVPVVALSQITRGVENREDKRPQLSDLRESGSIEQDADQVHMLFREEYYEELKEPKRSMFRNDMDFNSELADWATRIDACRGIAEVILAKHRFGQPTTVKVAFVANDQRFDDLQRYA